MRPQHDVNVDANSFMNGIGASHDVKFGVRLSRAPMR